MKGGDGRGTTDDQNGPSLVGPWPLEQPGLGAAYSADIGFLVAFVNRNDRHHEWAVRLAGGIHEPLLTCEAVLAEAAFHLQSTELVLAMLQQGLVTLAFQCREQEGPGYR